MDKVSSENASDVVKVVGVVLVEIIAVRVDAADDANVISVV